MVSHPSSSLAGVVLLASRIVCLIVVASFIVFAVNETRSASTHQQNELSGTVGTSESASGSARHEGTVHRTLDEAWSAITSPFAGVVSGSSSEWVIHLVRTILALLVYGLGVAFLVRFIRLRV
jgi:hypothetical protein